MSLEYESKLLWTNDYFDVRKLVLDSNTPLAGADLGEGVIYVRSPQHLIRRISSSVGIGTQASGDLLLSVPEIFLPEPEISPVFDLDPNYVWNPGALINLVNTSRSPLVIFHVGFKGPRAHKLISGRDFSLIVSNFLNGDWEKDFKASVQEDIQLMGNLAPGLVVGSEPSAKQLRIAEYARGDLNTKVRWYLNAKQPGQLGDQELILTIRSFNPFDLLTGRATSPNPRDGKVDVTVRTKHSGKDSPHWRVLADPMAYKGEGTRTLPFPRLSTPTDRELRVGDYWFWAEKDGIVSKGLKYSVEGSDTLDLPV
jgi:hypothetical protein